MKVFIYSIAVLGLLAFKSPEKTEKTTEKVEVAIGSSFSLINDTKEKVTIHTGSGIVSLNKGSKTSIGCNVGKEVCWANNGKKGKVIFKITKDLCGKTVKLSKLL